MNSGECIKILTNNKYLYIVVYIDKGLFVRAYEVPTIVLPKDICDADLGYEVDKALKISGALEIDDEDVFNSNSLSNEKKKSIDKDNQRLLKLNGLNKYNDFYKTLIGINCYREYGLESVILTPLYTKRDSFTGFNDGTVDKIKIPKSSDNETLGKAVREAFTRCKSIYKR